MIHFEIVREQLVCFGIHPLHSVENKGFNYRYFSATFTFGMILILMAIPILKLNTISEFASGCYDLTVVITLFASFVLLIWNGASIYRASDKFDELIQKRSERSDLKATYEEMNRKAEKYVNIMKVYLVVNYYGPMLLHFLHVSFIHFTRGLQTDDYRLVFPIWLPFDYQASFVAYSFAFTLELVSCGFSEKISRLLMCYVVESFLVLSQFTKDIKREILAMNENWKSDRNEVELTEKLHEIVWFNARINECIKEFNASYELNFLINFAWSLISICISLLLLQLELAKETMDLGAVGVTFVAAILSFGVVFIFCEIGEQLRSQTDDINDAICELYWNTFPLRAQRMIPMIILATQHPLKLASFGDIACARDTFKKIVNSAYSYFNVFRG